MIHVYLCAVSFYTLTGRSDETCQKRFLGRLQVGYFENSEYSDSGGFCLLAQRLAGKNYLVLIWLSFLEVSESFAARQD